MDQGKVETIIRDIISQEMGNSLSHKSVAGYQADRDDQDISPLLKALRDSVQAKTRDQSGDVDNSPLLEDLKREVEERIG
ncbi:MULTISPECIES: hypothetical protein [Lactobacillaceae]|uniref:hypothetical protein n=1 Tax=Lactobacillaceae TaxID=33958 RepID=UPI00145666FE|nr:hypothetical protein [Lactobacillus sp. HBUAS51381]NLR08993.1 hypothetical protein [Lactobacillus sp. HBUAS51381]